MNLCAWRTVFALEALNTSSSIHNLLLTREEWVACVADFNLDHRQSCASLKGIAANTAYFALNVFRMDIGFHDALQMRSNN
jgi:hypothetical protein